jgi:hypothetical protein
VVKKDNKNEETIITVEEEIIGPYYVNYVKRKERKKNNNNYKMIEDTRTIEEKELDIKALESIRRKAIKELESEDTTTQQKIKACWRLLNSCGFEEATNELQQQLQRHKSSNWLRGGF